MPVIKRWVANAKPGDAPKFEDVPLSKMSASEYNDYMLANPEEAKQMDEATDKLRNEGRRGAFVNGQYRELGDNSQKAVNGRIV